MSRLPRLRPGLGALVPAIRLPEDYARIDWFRRLAEDGVAGFLVFGGDDEFLPPFLASLQEAARRPLLIMADTECGVGQQVTGCIRLPPLMAVGATQSEERAYHHGRVTALEARAIGINMLLGPVADVLTRSDNPIVGSRSFGANPELVARLTAAWVAGAQDQGVLACAKHFPGHGDTDSDSHAALPSVDASAELMRMRELVPFKAAVQAGVGAVMTAHVAYPGLDPDPVRPATLSPYVLGEVLRRELGFGGLILSDALNMDGVVAAGAPGRPRLTEAEAAVLAVQAGCDLLLHPSEPYAVAQALEVAGGEDVALALTLTEGRLSLTLADLLVDSPAPQSLRAEHLYGAYGLARDSLTVIENGRGLLPVGDLAGRSVLGLLVDDDDDAERERPFHERIGEFSGGFVRRTGWKGDAADQAILGLVEEADLVLMAVACSIRAWKGRAHISSELFELVSRVLSVAGRKTICVLLSSPSALDGVEPAPETVVAAWGDAPVCGRAAIDQILSGRPLKGLDPNPPDAA